ncbi:hypothetical protein BKA65DRAFT_555532 [Rhexocercosporidium sp. MPI-PUGE-AT-0058]|nr:hypothetical protein BKA65DRAFT_555532 [Rhexocercosporidium sp. MPI-PUGE-AT-0058]
MSTAPGSFLACRMGRWDSTSYVEVLSELEDLGLVQGYDREENGFIKTYIHSLVKDWIVLRLSQDISLEYQILMSEILMEAMNPNNDQKDVLYPQSTIQERVCAIEALSNLYYRIPVSIDARHEKQLQRLLSAQTAMLEVMNQNGHYLEVENLGRSEEALSMYEELISLETRLLGQHNVRVLDIMVTLAEVHRMRETTRMVSLIAIASNQYKYRRTLGDCHFVLGCVYHDIGEWKSAIAELRGSWEHRSASHGENHITALYAKRQLAKALAMTSNFLESDDLYREVDTSLTIILGPGNTQTLLNKTYWALFYWKQGILNQAEKMYRSAYEDYIQDQGIHGDDTFPAMKCLALVLRDKGPAFESEARDIIKQFYYQLGGEVCSNSEDELSYMIERIFSETVDNYS